MNFLEMEVGHLFLNTILFYNTSHQPKLYRQKRGKRAAIIRYCIIHFSHRSLCKMKELVTTGLTCLLAQGNHLTVNGP